MKKFLVVSFLSLSLIVSSAPVASAATIAELQAQLNALMAQLTAMQAQIDGTGNILISAPTTIKAGDFCYTFTSNLKLGDGRTQYDEPMVRALQTALQKEGFFVSLDEQKAGSVFGKSTEAAVIGFQGKYASEILAPNGLTNGNGFVGVSTRAKLNALYGCENITTMTGPTYPTATITANYLSRDKIISVNIGSPVTLRWTYTNANGCVTDWGYSGAKDSDTVYPTTSRTYGVTCYELPGNAGRSVSTNLMVYVIQTETFVGDVNGDGSVTCVDSKMLADYSVGLITLTTDQKSRADVNRDGAVNIIDAQQIARLHGLNCSTSETPTSFQLLSPNNGESFDSGSNIPIKWTPGGPGLKRIELISADGRQFAAGGQVLTIYSDTVLGYQVPNTSGSFSYPSTWAVAGSAYIKVYQYGTSATDQSDKPITIGQTTTAGVAPIVSFLASPSSISVGQSSKLSWSATNATSCYLDNINGQAGKTSATEIVYPTQTTTYTLNCYNAAPGGGQTTTKRETVNVSGQTTTPVSFDYSLSNDGNKSGSLPLSGLPASFVGASVTRTTISGTPVNLTFSFSGLPNGVTVLGSPLSLPYNANLGTYNYSFTIYSHASSGTYPITITSTGTGAPTRTTVFNLTINSAQTITPSPTVSFNYNNSTSPVSVTSGGSVNFSWSATNINKCQMFKNGSLYNDGVYNTYGVNTPSYSGTFYVGNITSSATYTLTCTGAGGSQSASMIVNVSAPTPITTSGDDPYSANYSQTSATPLSASEKTVNYTYPYNPCGSLMTSYTSPGSVYVGNGPVYTSAVAACSPNTPNTTTFRVYSCSNNSSLQGQATFAFQCNPTTSSVSASQNNYASVYSALSSLLRQLSEQLGN